MNKTKQNYKKNELPLLKFSTIKNVFTEKALSLADNHKTS